MAGDAGATAARCRGLGVEPVPVDPALPVPKQAGRWWSCPSRPCALAGPSGRLVLSVGEHSSTALVGPVGGIDESCLALPVHRRNLSTAPCRRLPPTTRGFEVVVGGLCSFINKSISRLVASAACVCRGEAAPDTGAARPALSESRPPPTAERRGEGNPAALY